VLSARHKPPRGGAPIPRRVAPCLPPRPLRLVAPCPAPAPAHTILSLAASRCCRCSRSLPGGRGRCRCRRRRDAQTQLASSRDPEWLDLERASAAALRAPFLPRMLQAYVASVCFKCFRCFICMLQVFYVDVAKVDRDVAYVAMTIHVCCKRLFQMFQLFQTDVACVLSGCYICSTLMLYVLHPDVAYVFTHMLQVFYLDAAYILQWLHTCFSRVSDVCCKCFNCFGRCKSRSGVTLAHICSGPICSSCQLLGLPTCTRVWRGREKQAGNRAGVDRDRADVGHGATRDTERA
jgi:hypothetical protein